MLRTRVHRGSVSLSNYAAASILMRGSRATMARLARANCFDVVGGVSEAEVELLTPSRQATARTLCRRGW